jgi:hypothetical protein
MGDAQQPYKATQPTRTSASIEGSPTSKGSGVFQAIHVKRGVHAYVTWQRSEAVWALQVPAAYLSQRHYHCRERTKSRPSLTRVHRHAPKYKHKGGGDQCLETTQFSFPPPPTYPQFWNWPVANLTVLIGGPPSNNHSPTLPFVPLPKCSCESDGMRPAHKGEHTYNALHIGHNSDACTENANGPPSRTQ